MQAVDLGDGDDRRWPNQEASQFIDASGIRWHIQMMGQGPRLLLVHGTGASSHSWRDVMPRLAARFRVLTFDLPGHGFSQAASGASSIAGMSESIAGLLSALDFEPLYCVGHSAGAVILCRLALDRRIEPRVIISVNGAFLPLAGVAKVLFGPLAKLLARSSFMPRLLARRAANQASVARVLAGTGSKVDAAGLALYGRLVRRPQHLAGALDMMASWDLRAFSGDLPKLSVPLALLVGSGDRAVPAAQAAEVKRLVPGATIRVLEGLGHLAHEEDPGLLSAEIASICDAFGGSQ